MALIHQERDDGVRFPTGDIECSLSNASALKGVTSIPLSCSHAIIQRFRFVHKASITASLELGLGR